MTPVPVGSSAGSEHHHHSARGDLLADGLVVSPPVCTEDGRYRPEQGSGGLMWCVDPSGRPTHDSLTRGLVRCGADGEWRAAGVVEARSLEAEVGDLTV